MIAEEKQVEVFGTKEVSVKEFMGSSDKSLVLLSDHNLAKENLLALNVKHQARVTELVAIEELSTSELKELNACRSELREPRYLIQNIEKNNISVFEAYKKTDKANLKELIDINRNLEDIASEKIKSEEERKKAEKEAESKAEEMRIEKIKTDIDNIETYCSEIVQKMTFENMKVSAESIEKSLNADYEFEEYDILFDQVKGRFTKLLLDKTNDITARENQRLENEAMKQEIFDVRVNRLKELGVEELSAVEKPMGNGPTQTEQSQLKVVDNIYRIGSVQISGKELMEYDSTAFEKQLSVIKKAKEDAEQAKRDSELKKQKDEQFEIRKSRLVELGLICSETLKTFDYDNKVIAFFDTIYHNSITGFEQILIDAKKQIQEAKNQKELADAKCKELEELALKQKEEADKKLAADKKKADAENKARVKRLANDKKIISESFEVYFSDLHLETENQEIKDFIQGVNSSLQGLKKELLNQLNEL